MAEQLERQMRAMAEKLVSEFGPGAPELNAYSLASQFHSGALNCLTIREVPGQDAIEVDMAPGIVCLAFAAELYLKTLHLARTGKAPKGHKLHVLFGNLPADLSARIGSRYSARSGRSASEFSADVQGFGNAFAEWRYVYETDAPIHLELGRLMLFVATLFEAIHIERRRWPNPNAERFLSAELPRRRPSN